MKKGGLAVFGPPCSSWVWISRSKSKRSKANPAGDGDAHFVSEGNKIADVLAIALRFLTRRSVFWLVEQPQSSLLFDYAPIKEALAEQTVFSIAIKQGLFGSSSAKPTRLVGTVPWLLELKATERVQPKPTTWVSLAKRQGKRVTGRKALLEKSSAYPYKLTHLMISLHDQMLIKRQMTVELALRPLFASMHLHLPKCVATRVVSMAVVL